MEANTPINSPKRKKHSLVQKFVPVEESLGDIETEIQTRRQEAINKSTEARRRLSAVPLLAGYTSTQLAQHCKDVIKLSTENKINCKNAFNFWLIDVMAAMAKKTDSEIYKNFQVASCTLDASVKIYGYRVDAIHTDAVKMAGGFFSKEGEEEGAGEGEGEREREKDPKPRRKKKKLTVVAPESLNARSETEVLLDVVPRQNFLSRKTDGGDLLVKITKYNDGGLMLLDSDYLCWPCDSPLVPKFDNGETFDSAGLKSLFKGIQISKDEKLCPAYSDFEFGKDCEEESGSEDEQQMSQNSGRFEFDANASIDDVEEEEDCEGAAQRNRINIPAGGFRSDEDIVVQPERQKQNRSLAISDLKARITVDPLEYSMFDEKMLKAWAGPAHWKVRPVRKPLEEITNDEEVSKPVASKRTRKGKLKTHAGLFEILEEVLLKNMAENEKTTLFKSTMLHWNSQNTTVPEDLKCKARNLFSPYHIPCLTVSLRSEDISGREISDTGGGEQEEQEEDEEGEEEGEGEELEYCSASVVHHRDEEAPIAGAGDEAWDSGTMVEAPNRVEKIPVSTFKRRKHVDIKYLKRGLWNVLTGSEEKEETVSGTIDFEELVKVCPSKVAKSFGALLSPPLIFNALLHLTNEKCLVLTQDKADNLNFVISQ